MQPQTHAYTAVHITTNESSQHMLILTKFVCYQHHVVLISQLYGSSKKEVRAQLLSTCFSHDDVAFHTTHLYDKRYQYSCCCDILCIVYWKSIIYLSIGSRQPELYTDFFFSQRQAGGTDILSEKATSRWDSP